MFLDEKLLEICRNADCNTPEKIKELNRIVCRECELYYKSILNTGMTKAEVKATLDRTFNLFDSFVKMALKDKSEKLNILGEMFQEYTFRRQFLQNEKMAQVYVRL